MTDKQVWVVNKARVSSSWIVSSSGAVRRVQVPTYIHTDRRGVLLAVWVRAVGYPR